MHKRIFLINNGVVNSVGDAKYANNTCFHDKSFDEVTTATRHEMPSAEKEWIPRSSVPKPRTKKKIRTISVPAFKAPRPNDPRTKEIADMFLAPIFKNSNAKADIEDLSKRKLASKTQTTIDTQLMFKPPLSGYTAQEGDKKFAYSKLADCDVYEKQNFRIADNWYRLSDSQLSDFDFDLREDSTIEATKNERIDWMLDAVSAGQTTNESPKQTPGSEKKLLKKPTLLKRFSTWIGSSRKNVYM